MIFQVIDYYSHYHKLNIKYHGIANYINIILLASI